MVLFDRHKTVSEYNSPTYAGVTLMALGVTQFLPEASPMRVKGAEVIHEIWGEIGKFLFKLQVGAVLRNGS